MPICEYYSSLIPQFVLTTMAFLERTTLTDSYRCFLVLQVYHDKTWLTLVAYEYEHVQYPEDNFPTSTPQIVIPNKTSLLKAASISKFAV